MQVLGFHFVKNAKNKEILHVTGSNPVQYVRTATSMIDSSVSDWELSGVWQKKSALKFVTLHFEVNFLYLFIKCHAIL